MSTSEQVHELVNTVAEFVKGGLEDHIATLEAEVARLRAEVEDLARYIVNHGQGLPDHACAQCVPHSDMLISGFVCGYHKAIVIDAKRKEADRGN